MSSSIHVRPIAIAFAGVLVLYVATFQGIEFLRHRKGPWQVEFANAPDGPSISVIQPALGLAAVKIAFVGESGGSSNFTQRVALSQLRAELPFGRVIYADLTTLPGVVTFDLFGHEIELMPRVLVVNGREVPWRTGTTLELSPTNKPKDPPRPPKGWKG